MAKDLPRGTVNGLYCYYPPTAASPVRISATDSDGWDLDSRALGCLPIPTVTSSRHASGCVTWTGHAMRCCSRVQVVTLRQTGPASRPGGTWVNWRVATGGLSIHLQP